MYGAIDTRRQSEKRVRIAIDRLTRVEVQVAVTQMAVRDDARVGTDLLDRGRRFHDEGGQLGGGDRHVVLDARAFEALGFGHRFTQTPELFALSLIHCERSGEHLTTIHGIAQLRFDAVAKPGLRATCADLQQHVPRIFLVEGIARIRDMPEYKIERDAG